MKWQHVTLALLVTLIWGSAFTFIQIGLAEFPPVFNSALRFLTASIPWVFFIKRPNVSWKFILLFGMNYVFMFSLMYIGMEQGMPAGLTSLVLQSAVVFAIGLSAIVFREIPSIIQVVGVFIGGVGLFLIGSGMGEIIPAHAFLLVLGAGFFYGASSIIIKRAGSVDMLALLIWGCLVPPIPLLILSFIIEDNQLQSLINISGKGIFTIYYTSALGTVFAFACWGYLLKKYPANLVVPFNLLVPLFGIITSFALLGEIITAKVMVAAALILLGLLIICFHHRIRIFSSRFTSGPEVL